MTKEERLKIEVARLSIATERLSKGFNGLRKIFEELLEASWFNSAIELNHDQDGLDLKERAVEVLRKVDEEKANKK